MSKYHEIYVQEEKNNNNNDELFATLTPQERIFVYFMNRSILPFNRIHRDQNHRHNNEIISVFEFLYENKEHISKDLLIDVELYLVYLWSNHGIYFLRDKGDNKFTPGKLKMKTMTAENLSIILDVLDYPLPYGHLLNTIFNPGTDAQMIVDGSIEKSGNNYYC